MFEALSNRIKKIRTKEINKKLLADLMNEESDYLFEDQVLTKSNNSIKFLEKEIVRNIVKNPRKFLEGLNIDIKSLSFVPEVKERNVIITEAIKNVKKFNPKKDKIL